MTQVPESPFEADFDKRISNVLDTFGETVNAHAISCSERDKYICNEALLQCESIKERFASISCPEEGDNEAFTNKLAKCEKYIKVVYQNIVKALVKAEDKFDVGTRKSSLEDTTNPTVLENEDLDFSME